MIELSVLLIFWLVVLPGAAATTVRQVRRRNRARRELVVVTSTRHIAELEAELFPPVTKVIDRIDQELWWDKLDKEAPSPWKFDHSWTYEPADWSEDDHRDNGSIGAR